MAADTPSTILLHGRDSDRKKGEAAGAIDPGDLLEVSGTQTAGAADERQVQRHSSAPATDTEGAAIPRFALEFGKTGLGIDDAYASGDSVEYRTCLTGDEVYAWLAAGESVTEDDPLESAGNGALAQHTGSDDADTTATQTYYDGAIVAHAIETVDNGAGGSKVRIRVEVR